MYKRQVLKEILSLEASGKVNAARALELQARTEVQLSEEEAKLQAQRRGELAKKRASQLRTNFFSLGSWELTADVLKRFLNTPEVKRLMPGSARQTRSEQADAKIAAELLSAAKRFFGEIMDTKGRRSELDMNAFWAAISALMPAGLLEGRGGRAASRILGVHHRVIEKGVQVRKDLEERGEGWVHLEYSGHSDRVDRQIIWDWWHSDLASVEDNQNKEPIRVYVDEPRRAIAQQRQQSTPSAAAATVSADASDAAAASAASAAASAPASTRAYFIHWRRAQSGSMPDSLVAFQNSPHAQLLKEATKTAKRPNGVAVGVKLLRRARCACVRPRRAAECDCTICSVVQHNLPLFHRSRQVWRKAVEACECGTCSSPESKAQWLDLTKSLRALETTLLPCGKVPYPQISSAAGPPFEMYRRECTQGKCGHLKPALFRPPCPNRAAGNNALCGWRHAFPHECPIEYSTTERMRWHAWEPRLRGTSKDGSDFYADELVPRDGRRAQFMREFVASVEVYLPHIWEVRLMRHAVRLFEERKDEFTVTRLSDYASQVPIVRPSTATCQSKEHINNCVSVMGYSPRLIVRARTPSPLSTVRLF